jgi:hypothetical protein
MARRAPIREFWQERPCRRHAPRRAETPQEQRIPVRRGQLETGGSAEQFDDLDMAGRNRFDGARIRAAMMQARRRPAIGKTAVLIPFNWCLCR